MKEKLKGNILIIDDEREIRQFLADVVTSLGATAFMASNGQAGLEAVKLCEPDLILLDVEMPIMNGLACCKILKDDPRTRHLPIIILTSLSDINDRINGIRAGADDYIVKPPHVEELAARIGSLLRVKKLNESLESAESVVFALAHAIEARDRCTEQHTERVTKYAVALGKLVGCTDDEMLGLRQGGALHDIGKVSVPDGVLNKPGKLTPEEFAIIMLHPVTGYNICASMKSLAHTLPCIRWHHEKPNGKGYPDGLKGDAIPRRALILAVADVYDALTSERPYKKGFPVEKAVSILREEAASGGLDAGLVNLFIDNGVHVAPVDVNQNH